MGTPSLGTPALGTVLVVAKEPVPGRVKTRLAPPLTLVQAAEVAAAMLSDTLREVASWPASRHVLLLDGGVPPGVPGCFTVLPQVSGPLDVRLGAGFDAAVGPTLLVGMDTPQLSAAAVAGVLDGSLWRDADAVIGPAADGGFWALAMAVPDGDAVRGVQMSRSDTGALQVAQLVASGRRVGQLPVLRDVDTASDAAEVAAACAAASAGSGAPSRFAQVWDRCAAQVASW